MRKGILTIMIGSIILEALLVCTFILFGIFDDIFFNSLWSAALILIYSVPCLIYSKIYDNKRYRYIAICGSIVVCISVMLTILGLWKVIYISEFLRQIIDTLNVAIWMFVFISWVLSFTSVNKILNVFKKISVTLTVLLSTLIAITIWVHEFMDEFLFRLYFVVIILTISSLICTYILEKFYNKESRTSNKIDENPENDNLQRSQSQNVVNTQTTMIPMQPTNSMESIPENVLSNNVSEEAK